MWKNAINTFSEGINYDLNPLVTPSNTLSDCVNGTLLTFNGDELVLQNDAGNSRIKIYYPTSSEYDNTKSYSNGNIVSVTEDVNIKYFKNVSGLKNDTSPLTSDSWVELPNSEVKLSEGFTPIGVKEYGGILYIVSAKYPSIVPKEFISGVNNIKDEVVYITVLNYPVYYKCLVNNTDVELPLESNENWLYIGKEEDFNNYYGEIEIGSYPSPEAGGPTYNDGDIISYTTIEELKNYIYSYRVTNDEEFKYGRYVQFKQDLTINTSEISHYSGNNYIMKFYKVRLFHQLENGYIDLTNDIWDKYKTFKNNLLDDTTFWFNDPTFKYYCPNKYKGFLVVCVDIEQGFNVRLTEAPYITKSSTGYILNIKGTVDIISSLWDVTGFYLKRSYSLDESSSDVYTTYNTSGNFHLEGNINQNKKGYTVNFELNPRITYKGTTIPFYDFPTIFNNNNLITGSIVIDSELDDIVFEIPTSATYECNVDLGLKIYDYFVLKNSEGNYIDENLTVTSTPHIFLKQGKTTPSDVIVLANYAWSSSGLTFTNINATLSAEIIERAKFFSISELSGECSMTTVTIKVRTPQLLETWSLTQSDEIIPPLKVDMVLLEGYSNLIKEYTFTYSLQPKIGENNNSFEFEFTDNDSSTFTNNYYVDSSDGKIKLTSDSTVVGENKTLELTWRMNEFIDLYVETNIPVLMDGDGASIVILQETTAGWIRPMWSMVTTKKLLCRIDAYAKIKIIIIKQGYEDVEYIKTLGSVSETIKLGLIGIVNVLTVQSTNIVEGQTIQALYINWERFSKLNISNVPIEINLLAGGFLSSELVWDNTYESFRYEQILEFQQPTSIEVVGSSLPPSTYSNIVNNANYVYIPEGSLNIHIFPKITNWV